MAASEPVSFGESPSRLWFSHCPQAPGSPGFHLAPRTGADTLGQPGALSPLCRIPQVGLTCGEAFLGQAGSG